MNLVLSGPIDATLLNLCVARTKPREIIRLHDKAQRLVGADDTPDARQAVAILCHQARVDHAFVEEGLRFSDFKLLAMDMDSTLITIECIDEIADYAGKKAEVAAITEAAMRGELDFAESLRRRVKLLEGLKIEILSRVYIERLRITNGGEELIEISKKNNLCTALVSGGFSYFTEKLKSLLYIDYAHSNTLEINNQKLSGLLKGKIVDGLEKLSFVERISTAHNIVPSCIIAIGDGANDVPMLRHAGLSIAFHAKSLLKENATQSIDFGGLNVVCDWLA